MDWQIIFLLIVLLTNLLSCYAAWVSVKYKKILLHNVLILRAVLEKHFEKCDKKECNNVARAGIDVCFKEELKEIIEKTKKICDKD